MSEKDILATMNNAAEFELPALNTISHRDLMAAQYEPLRWIIPDLLPEGLTLLVGPSKIGKSWLSLDLCRSVAFGLPTINGKCPVPGDVLYLALEDSERRLQDRFKMIAQGNPTGSERLHFCTDAPRSHEGGLELLTRWLDDYPHCRLIVIDTLQRFREQSSRGVETYASDYEAMIPLQTLAKERRLGLVLVHHTRKSEAKDPFDRISGTTAIMGASDCAWILTRARGEADGKLNITGRDVDEQDLAMRFEKTECRWRVLGEASQVAASDEERQVLDLLSDADAPVTPSQTAKELGIDIQAAKMRLARLCEKGKAEKAGRGKYVLVSRRNDESHKVTEGHTEGVTMQNRSVIPFPAQSHKVTHPLAEPERILAEKKCDLVTLEAKPLQDKASNGHTPDVTLCDLVTFQGDLLEGEFAL